VQFDQLKRREFIALVGSAAAWPLAGRGQEPGRVYRLGNVFSAPRDAVHHVALFAELRNAGFVGGHNLTVDWRGYGLRVEQFDEHAEDLAKARVDVIQAGGDAAVRAAQRATRDIPILALTDDMVGHGFVRSLSTPNGNITGVTILGSELDSKRQEILFEAVPGIHRIGVIADRNVTPESHLKGLQNGAHALGAELSVHWAIAQEDIAPAIDAAKSWEVDAINVLASALFFNNLAIIFDRVTKLRLPAMYQWPEIADQGGLIGYGPRIVQLYRDVISRQLIKLLRGAKPVDIPVEQPTKFDLVINLRTARTIQINVPATVLSRADHVIE
jgi:putative ABC transport system substrate-binding protein